MAISQNDDDGPTFEEDPIKWLIGKPEDSFQYMEGVANRLMSKLWPLVILVIVLYFIFGP